ncbi:MAG: hydrolase [Proteobacteria bacterium]|nr:hydrolase [Pseudomonadota bacterium]
MSRFAIAGLQLELPNRDNVEYLCSEVETAVRRFPWLDMVVLGELASFGPNTTAAQPMPGPAEETYRALAQRLGVWLVPGSLYERSDGRIYNTAPVIDPSGKVVARCRKLFPWLPYEKDVAAGQECVVFDVPRVGRFGISICYDMWFPETTRALAWQGAEVLIHPTMTSTIDRDVELAMVRTTAATNQCYVVDVNAAGRLGNGRSIVAGPGGEVIYQAGTTREFVPVMIDLSQVRDARRRGWHGQGQVLKSFRDSAVRYPQYQPGARSPQLDALGAMAMPARAKLDP